MNVIAFIFLVVAAVIFGVDAYLHKTLIGLGLCVLTVGLIIQFGATAHTLTF
jgi:hypothetical protein